MEYTIKTIARIKTDFPEKFGVPRQAGLVEALEARIVFEPEYRNPDALRGLEGFSHIWLIWQFSQALREDWSPTVRPPRLGGNTRMGVFATRSPFRPNPVGLSSVKLVAVRQDKQYGTVLDVEGADLMDGTPIYDIKPYIAYADSHPEARDGFAPSDWQRSLELDFPLYLYDRLPEDDNIREALCGVLRNDPRPSYHNDPERVYGMDFGTVDVKFTVKDGLLTVVGVERKGK